MFVQIRARVDHCVAKWSLRAAIWTSIGLIGEVCRDGSGCTGPKPPFLGHHKRWDD